MARQVGGPGNVGDRSKYSDALVHIALGRSTSSLDRREDPVKPPPQPRSRKTACPPSKHQTGSNKRRRQPLPMPASRSGVQPSSFA